MTTVMKETPGARDVEDLEIDLLLEGIRRRYGCDLQEYDRGFIRERVFARRKQEGVASTSQLQERVLRHPASFTALVDPRGDDESTVFRPVRVWKALRRRVLPALRTYPSVRVWVAGSSPDGELLSLLILLQEGLPRPFTVYATDLVDPLARESRFGRFRSGLLRRSGARYAASGGQGRLTDYLLPGEAGFRLLPALRSRVVFATHNLATDASFNAFHLVLLRWSLSQFAPPLQERSLHLVHQSLVRLGFLVLAPHESPGLGAHAAAYRPVHRGAGLYQKSSE